MLSPLSSTLPQESISCDFNVGTALVLATGTSTLHSSQILTVELVTALTVGCLYTHPALPLVGRWGMEMFPL